MNTFWTYVIILLIGLAGGLVMFGVAALLLFVVEKIYTGIKALYRIIFHRKAEAGWLNEEQQHRAEDDASDEGVVVLTDEELTALRADKNLQATVAHAEAGEWHRETVGVEPTSAPVAAAESDIAQEESDAVASPQIAVQTVSVATETPSVEPTDATLVNPADVHDEPVEPIMKPAPTLVVAPEKREARKPLFPRPGRSAKKEEPATTWGTTSSEHEVIVGAGGSGGKKVTAVDDTPLEPVEPQSAPAAVDERTMQKEPAPEVAPARAERPARPERRPRRPFPKDEPAQPTTEVEDPLAALKRQLGG